MCFRKELREIKDSGETKLLLDCSIGILFDVLTQAQQVGLMVSEHSYIIASLVSKPAQTVETERTALITGLVYIESTSGSG